MIGQHRQLDRPVSQKEARALLYEVEAFIARHESKEGIQPVAKDVVLDHWYTLQNLASQVLKKR